MTLTLPHIDPVVFWSQAILWITLVCSESARNVACNIALAFLGIIIVALTMGLVANYTYDAGMLVMSVCEIIVISIAVFSGRFILRRAMGASRKTNGGFHDR